MSTITTVKTLKKQPKTAKHAPIVEEIYAPGFGTWLVLTMTLVLSTCHYLFQHFWWCVLSAFGRNAWYHVPHAAAQMVTMCATIMAILQPLPGLNYWDWVAAAAASWPLVMILAVMVCMVEAIFRAIRSRLILRRERIAAEASLRHYVGPPDLGTINTNRITVEHDDHGSWLVIHGDNGQEVRQFITPAMREEIIGTSRKEMAIARSRPMPLDVEPDDFFTFRNIFEDGSMSPVLACGSRISVKDGGSELMITAYHVWKALIERGLPAHIVKRVPGTNPVEYKTIEVNPEWKIYAMSRELDFVVVRVSNEVWSRLGVSPIKVGVAHNAAPVRVAGYMGKNLVQTYGIVRTFVKCPLGLLHTCTTIPSFSGTIIRKGNVAVGLHVQAAPPSVGSYNIAISLGLLSRTPESDESEKKLWQAEIEQVAREWDRKYDAMIEFENKAYRAMSKGSKYFLEEVEMEPLDGKSWGDYMDDLEEEVVYPWEMEDMDYGHSTLRGVCESAIPPLVPRPVRPPAKISIRQEDPIVRNVGEVKLETRTTRQRKKPRKRTKAAGSKPVEPVTVVPPQEPTSVKVGTTTRSLSGNERSAKKKTVPSLPMNTPGTASSSSSTSGNIRGPSGLSSKIQACSVTKPVVRASASVAAKGFKPRQSSPKPANTSRS